jgi:hypothetical protein
MDREEKQKIDRALELAEDNNQMLRKMIRNMRWGRLFTTVYWVIIIGISIGALYYVQPYVDQIMSAYGNIQDASKSVNNMFTPKGN